MSEQQSEIVEGGPLNPIEVIDGPEQGPPAREEQPVDEGEKTDQEKADAEGVDLELYQEMKARGLRS